MYLAQRVPNELERTERLLHVWRAKEALSDRGRRGQGSNEERWQRLEFARDAECLALARTWARPLRREDLERSRETAAEAAPPGFVNFRLSSTWLSSQVDAIVAACQAIGFSGTLTNDLLGPDTDRFTYGLFKPIFAASASHSSRV